MGPPSAPFAALTHSAAAGLFRFRGIGIIRLALVVLFLFAAPLAAQSRVLELPDRFWESVQRRHPVLYTFDDTREKTWLWHGALTWGIGGLIGAASPLSARQGRHVMLGFYVLREACGIFGGNRNWVDIGGDIGFPLLAARVRF